MDGADNTTLSGAVFTLTGSDGSESTLTTDENGTVTFENLVFGVTYVWKEVQAPKGYLLNEENTGIWSVEEHDAEIQYLSTAEVYVRSSYPQYTRPDRQLEQELWGVRSNERPGTLFRFNYCSNSAYLFT